ncbi:hypothetical protein JCM19235_3842 [Vibrio maritimus]|uniref:Uncharacterized protein n=1 Tax=Vibrio maritimus TaxID=990268 RepID=A0A090RZE3_9VIBR|nr:hypothetical protein JCM19235_3842 [Vibrio maritimus]
MAYLPFYLTPEEFEAYQEEQEKQIKQGLHTHEWSCHNIEEPNRYGAFQFTVLSLIPVALMMAYVGYIGYIKLNGFAAFCVLVLFCTLTYAWYLTVGVDNHYRYVLSEFGFVQKKNRAEPEWVNKVMLIIAWVSAIGCLVAVSVAGPMALAVVVY